MEIKKNISRSFYQCKKRKNKLYLATRWIFLYFLWVGGENFVQLISYSRRVHQFFLQRSLTAFIINDDNQLFVRQTNQNSPNVRRDFLRQFLAIYVPMISIYMASCVMLLVRAASITRASGRGVGPGKSTLFWGLWNGIEPIDECHLGPKKSRVYITYMVHLQYIRPRH